MRLTCEFCVGARPGASTVTFLPHCTTCSCTAPPPAAASGVNRLRSVIDAWVTALGLDRSPEVHHDTGRIHLGRCQECIPFGGEFLMTTEPDLREQFAPSGDALC